MTVKSSPQLTDIKPPLTPTSTKPATAHRKHKHTNQSHQTTNNNNNNDHNMIDLKQFNAQQPTREQLMDMMMSQAAAVMMQQQQQQPAGPTQFSQQVRRV